MYSVKLYIGYNYNNVDSTDSMMLKYSWLKFIDTPLFTVCVVTCVQISNIKVFGSGMDV